MRKNQSVLDMRLLLVLVVVSILFSGWEHRARSDNRTSYPRAVAGTMLTPFQRFFTATASGIHSVGHGFVRARELTEENRRLREQNDALEADKARLTEAFIENQEIKRSLGFVDDIPTDRVAARVIARSFGVSRRRLTIEAPPGRELEVGNIVRTQAGLVGRVVDARGSRGEVFLLVDGEHAVAGIVERSRNQGIVRVAARPDYLPDRLVLEKLVGHSDIRENDRVLTSGLGEVYPPGIPIGVVTGVRRSTAGAVALTATIRPYVDFDRLEYVWVVRHGR